MNAYNLTGIENVALSEGEQRRENGRTGCLQMLNPPAAERGGFNHDDIDPLAVVVAARCAPARAGRGTARSCATLLEVRGSRSGTPSVARRHATG